jgi:hypothetical protein
LNREEKRKQAKNRSTVKYPILDIHKVMWLKVFSFTPIMKNTKNVRTEIAIIKKGLMLTLDFKINDTTAPRIRLSIL